MTFKKVVELYVEWAYGFDETLRQSYLFGLCDEYGYDYDEVVKEGYKLYEYYEVHHHF